MSFGDGDDLKNQLMNAKGICPNCGASLTFEDSATLAKNNGVSENAIMCPNCRKVFNVNLTPDKLTVLNEITKYNFSSNNNAEEVIGLPDDFQKKVSRDKKIIIGSIVIVAILIIIALMTFPYMMYTDDYYVDTTLDDCNDISGSSNASIKITDAYKDPDGWYFVHGEVSISTVGYSAVADYYDVNGNKIASDSYGLGVAANTEQLLTGVDLNGANLDHIDIGIIDENNNIVARTTYHVNG